MSNGLPRESIGQTQPERNPSLLVQDAMRMTFYEKTFEVSWWMLCLGRSRGQTPWGLQPLGFWPWDLPRHSIHHDTPLAFPNNEPLWHYTGLGQQILVGLNPNIPIRDAIRMGFNSTNGGSFITSPFSSGVPRDTIGKRNSSLLVRDDKRMNMCEKALGVSWWMESLGKSPGQKPWGPAAPWVLDFGLPQGTPFAMIHPRLSHPLSQIWI